MVELSLLYSFFLCDGRAHFITTDRYVTPSLMHRWLGDRELDLLAMCAVCHGRLTQPSMTFIDHVSVCATGGGRRERYVFKHVDNCNKLLCLSTQLSITYHTLATV